MSETSIYIYLLQEFCKILIDRLDFHLAQALNRKLQIYIRVRMIAKRIAPSPLFCTSYRNVPSPCTPAHVQCLHTTVSRLATPLPITATGPPPAAPQPAASQYGERVDRRRRQAELLKRGQDMRASHMKPGTAIKKRFWKDVSVQRDDGMNQISVRSTGSVPLLSCLPKALC